MARQLDLLPDERVVLAAHPHWWFFWKHALGGVGVLALVAIGVAWDRRLGTLVGWLGTLAFVVWLASAVYAYFSWQTTSFVITDRRVAYESGMFRRRGVSIPLTRVSNVNFQQSFIARLLGNGVVTIESAGDTGDSVFQNIPEPGDARRTIFEQMQAATIAESVRNAEAVADAVGRGAGHRVAGSTPEERLQELDRLRTKGLLTEDEYVERRSQVLDSL
jgi:uncharacterized membrane protein YdbT with pleckstrin-like domain